MKYLMVFILTIFSVTTFSQDTVSKLLHSSESNVTDFMTEHLPLYQLQKDSVDTSNVKTLEFLLSGDSVKTGILVYLFYYENPYEDVCTSIRLVFYDEDKFHYAFKYLTSNLKQLNVNQWYDDRNNIKISTFFTKSVKEDVSFYFMDIEPYDN